MATTKIASDLHVAGRITAQTMTVPANSVGDDAIPADAAIDATKLDHQHVKLYSQPNTAATSVTQVIHVAKAAGVLEYFDAGSIAIAIGAATLTFDLKKNGTTVLSGVITLDTGNTARVAEAGTITVDDYVSGDVFEIVTVATAGGGTLPTGAFCQAVFNEGAA